MKPTKTKKEIRNELNKQIEDFLTSGGNVNEVERGLSGNTTNENLFKNTTAFTPKQERTPVTDVVKELEARKGSGKTQQSARKRPKKVLLTDDFGDPIRWVWEE